MNLKSTVQLQKEEILSLYVQQRRRLQEHGVLFKQWRKLQGLRDSISLCLTIVKTIPYLKKGSFEGECHPSGCDNKNAGGRNDAFRLWDRLTVIIYEKDYEIALML